MSGNDGNMMAAAELLDEAEALLVTAGAGMGVDSGLPDFRGGEGFWNAYPPMRRLGISFAEMANPYWFDADPELAWGFYGHRLNLYRRTKPHEGFSKLLDMGEKKKGGYFVFTSNVDGQFQKASFDPGRVVECHGSIHHLQCKAKCSDAVWSAGMTEVEIHMETFRARAPLPACISCGGLARPNILMFGDWGWIPDRTERQEEAFSLWLEEIRHRRLKLVIVEIGAGHAVPTVRYRSERAALSLGGTLIRINPRDAEVPSGHISIPLGAAEGINSIMGNA